MAISNHPYIVSSINNRTGRQIASPYISCITRLSVKNLPQHLPTTSQYTQRMRALRFCHNIPSAQKRSHNVNIIRSCLSFSQENMAGKRALRIIITPCQFGGD